MVLVPLALIVSVILIVLATAKFKVNVFIVLIGVAFLYGWMVGLPLPQIITEIRKGFGGTLGYIGIVIVAGTIIGSIWEKTGAARSITRAILKVVGPRRSPLAMNAAGYAVSIPVFCDSGFVILTPLNKALSKATKQSMAVMATALGTGLYATHTLVPPTPGPIAAAGILGADLGRVILFGLIVSIPAALAGLLWALKVGKRYPISPEQDGETNETVRRFTEQDDRAPGAFHSSLPLLLPVALMVLRSFAEYPSRPFGEGTFATVLSFLGDPVTALTVGVGIALTLVKRSQLKEAVDTWMTDGVKKAALILAITGAGGAFGAVLKASPISELISDNLAGLKLGIFLPFLVSSALKTAQGSSTVAIITTSSIISPLVASLGLDPVLTVLAIGAGAMVVSHANDSFFWVVSQFSGLSVSTAYKTFSVATLVEGLVAFGGVFLLSFIL